VDALFHGLSALALAVFAWGVFERVRFWLGPSFQGRTDRRRRAKEVNVGATFRSPAGGLKDSPTVRRRSLSLRTLFWNGLVQRQLWRESRQRWLMHVSLSWSFVGLFIIGSGGNYLIDLGAPLAKDDHWFAATNDFLGLTLLLGVAIALQRRFLSPKPYVRTAFDDTAILALLAFLALSGFLVEAGRYLKEGTTDGVAVYAFVGYPLSRALDPLSLDWARAWDAFWWLHASSGLALVAYLPYSKLFHMFASPATIAIRAPTAEEAPAWSR
jgi:nitrate reductase gamma subunit